jgi:hypothetical protein
MTGPWSMLSWYANAQRTRFGPASAKGCQSTLPHMGAIGMRQARRKPIKRRPCLFWTGAEGWLRQRVSEGKENFHGGTIFVPTL